jgi:hypothetical protein
LHPHQKESRIANHLQYQYIPRMRSIYCRCVDVFYFYFAMLYVQGDDLFFVVLYMYYPILKFFSRARTRVEDEWRVPKIRQRVTEMENEWKYCILTRTSVGISWPNESKKNTVWTRVLPLSLRVGVSEYAMGSTSVSLW